MDRVSNGTKILSINYYKEKRRVSEKKVEIVSGVSLEVGDVYPYPT